MLANLFHLHRSFQVQELAQQLHLKGSECKVSSRSTVKKNKTKLVELCFEQLVLKRSQVKSKFIEIVFTAAPKTEQVHWMPTFNVILNPLIKTCEVTLSYTKLK